MIENINITNCLIILFVLLTIFLILPLILTKFLYSKTFGIRVDYTDNYYSYILKSCPNFNKTATNFTSNKGQKLKGYFYFYNNQSYKGLIVIAHGMGGGHENYIAEIEYFAKNGYLVFAYDNTGTNESEGQKLIGLSQSTIDLHYALKFIENVDNIKKLPLFLFGHSWGGFAVSAVNNYPHSVKAIVSVSGFEESQNVLEQQGKALVGKFISIFMPYVNLYERIIFGNVAKFTGISGLLKTDAKVMIIHSENDKIVDYKKNFMKYKETFKNNPRFTFLSLPVNGHNAVLSQKASTSIREIDNQMKLCINKQSDEYLLLQNQKNLLTLEFDLEVMHKIMHFYDNAATTN